MATIWPQIPKNWRPLAKNWISWAKLSTIWRRSARCRSGLVARAAKKRTNWHLEPADWKRKPNMKPTKSNAKDSWSNTVSYWEKKTKTAIKITNFSDDMLAAISKCKALLLEKADPNSSRSQEEITEEVDHIVNGALSKFSIIAHFLFSLKHWNFEQFLCPVFIAQIFQF